MTVIELLYCIFAYGGLFVGGYCGAKWGIAGIMIGGVSGCIMGIAAISVFLFIAIYLLEKLGEG